MNTAKAMKKVGLRYFSSLTPLQKDKTIFNILILKHGLSELPVGLAKMILFEINDIEVREKIEKTKLFKKGNHFYPLNFAQIITK